jgi:hydroxyquinol 1,2-dioxygenase
MSGSLPENEGCPAVESTRIMIIKDQSEVTTAVLSEVERAQDPRTREILGALVRHLHAFAREVRLTEKELREGAALVADLGHHTNESHNEVILACGSLGLSTLICLLNNGNNGQTETTANMLGPFWRVDSPRTENGASIVRSPTPGAPLVVTATVRDQQGKPVEGAEVDVWHSSTEGFYENQDPGQADMNLRGKFTTDAEGRISFHSIKPAGYPIPIDGPVGRLLRAQGRHNMRPAHVHFLISKPGYKTHISQVYSNDDPNLETDVQFGVTQALVGNYIRHENGEYSLDQTFVIEPGDSALPRAPISGKAGGERPVLAVLERK